MLLYQYLVLLLGGGHGPFVEISIVIFLVGILISGFSLLVFIILIISSLFNKEVFSKHEGNLQSIPTYNWRCPKCDSVVKANTGECKQCNFKIMK